MEQTHQLPDRPLGIALIGTGFMGKCHAMAWRNVSLAFGGMPPRLAVLCDLPEDKATRRAAEFGFDRGTSDWQQAVQDPEVEIVSITTPNDMHRPMAEAALKAGKHVWLEKPMGITLADAESMAATAAAHPRQVTLLGYNYLRAPAVQAACALIAAGEIGEPVSFRGVYDEDFCADPNRPWTWREGKEAGGLGVMGDMGCHMISVILALMGPIAELSGMTQTTVPTRPSPEGPKAVENEDSAFAMLKFASGAIGSFATSRVAIGRKCRLQWEVHGTKGSIVFDQEHMNELWVSRFGDAGFTRILTGPEQPDFGAFCPAPGHNFGFNEMKVIEARNLLSAICGGPACGPDFADGLMIERIIFAIATSDGQWQKI